MTQDNNLTTATTGGAEETGVTTTDPNSEAARTGQTVVDPDVHSTATTGNDPLTTQDPSSYGTINGGEPNPVDPAGQATSAVSVSPDSASTMTLGQTSKANASIVQPLGGVSAAAAGAPGSDNLQDDAMLEGSKLIGEGEDAYNAGSQIVGEGVALGKKVHDQLVEAEGFISTHLGDVPTKLRSIFTSIRSMFGLDHTGATPQEALDKKQADLDAQKQ